MLRFFYFYLRSMRLYYGFVTATTVLAGLYYWHRFGFRADSSWQPTGWTIRDVVLLSMGFFAWGFNQIFSDWCDREEDAINAPHRPMVTGDLKPLPAFAVSSLGLLAIAAAGWMMSPWTLLFLAAGGALNIAYSLFKRIPVLNCLVYACAISCCALFAIAGISGRCPSPDEFGFVAAWIVPVHFLMCHNSYYKDVPGDRAAKVRTLQTLSPALAKCVTMSLSGLAVLIALFTSILNHAFLPFAVLAAMIAAGFCLCVARNRFHRATCLNCQLCVLLLHFSCWTATWPSAIASLVAIQILFLWYDDEKE